MKFYESAIVHVEDFKILHEKCDIPWNTYPECDKHVVGSVDDCHVSSGAEPWHHAMTQEPHCYNPFPPVTGFQSKWNCHSIGHVTV